MDSDPYSYRFTIILVLLLSFFVSTFFSVVKILFSAVDKSSIPSDNERMRYFASKIEDVLSDKKRFANVVAFGKTLSNILFAMFVLIAMEEYFPSLGHFHVILYSMLFSTAILTFFSYSLIRAFAVTWSQNIVIPVYTVYSFFSWLFALFALVMQFITGLVYKIRKYDEKFSFLTETEKSRMNENSENDESLDKEEIAMIRNIFEFGDTTAKEIMLPRVDVLALEIKTGYHETLEFISKTGHSRYPVFKENIDSISGILYVKDVLHWISKNKGTNRSVSWNLEEIIKPAFFVPNSKKLDDLMEELNKNHVHIAVVVDEYGGTEGIVTMEDILEEIVGEIEDEYDKDNDSVRKISENSYVVNPHMDLDDLSEIINYHFSDSDSGEYNTIGGLFYHEYGDIPKENATLEFDGLKLRVLKVDGQRILKLEVEVIRSGQKEPVDVEKTL